MSWTKEITIWCDVCSQWEQGSSVKVTALRKELKRQGWASYKEDGQIKDCCPACQTKAAQERHRRKLAGRDRDEIYRYALKRSAEIKEGLA